MKQNPCHLLKVREPTALIDFNFWYFIFGFVTVMVGTVDNVFKWIS